LQTAITAQCSSIKLVFNNIPTNNDFNHFDFNKADWDAITAELSVVDWGTMLDDNSSDLPQQVSNFYDVLQKVVDSHVPAVHCANK